MGQLFLVGVPIGNYEDITYRAVSTLQSVDVIAAEDTRKAARLLAHLKIKAPQLIAHGNHNEHASANGILKLIADGKSVAYISDAGMPGISDPGYLLAKNAQESGVNVSVIPGVSALTTAVVQSALPCDRFVFCGFPPRKGARKKELERVKNYPETLVFYESPRRVLTLLEDAYDVLGDRPAALLRELTKTHEEHMKNNLSYLINNLKERAEILGEFCVIISGAEAEEQTVDIDVDAAIRTGLEAGKKAKDIRDELHAQTGLPKKDLYDRITHIKSV